MCYKYYPTLESHETALCHPPPLPPHLRAIPFYLSPIGTSSGQPLIQSLDMTSRTGPYTIQRELKHLIFSDTHLTASACALVFNDLLRDINQVSRILSDRDVSGPFLSNFDKYAERISQFFKQVDGSVQATRNAYVGSGLPDELVSGFLLRLLGDEFCRFQTKPSFHGLFSSIVGFCLTFRSAQLGMLAKVLGEKEQLLELLVSGENSGRVMRNWIYTFDTGSPLFVSNVFAAWAKRLVTLCGHCEGNHGVSRQFRIWRKLQDLTARLTEVINNFQSAPEKTPKLVPLEDLRQLTDSDKKSSSARWAQNSSGIGLMVAQEDKDSLANFGIAPPASERALQNVLEQLRRDEVVKVLRVLADTFPCRPCYQTSMGGPVVGLTDEVVQIEHRIRGPASFTELFGTGLGIWRICISAQALKDLGQSRSEGTSQQVCS